LGGYFLTDRFLGRQIVSGQMVDMGRVSIIIKGGYFDQVSGFNFLKQYDGDNELIDYQFRKEGDIWVGGYGYRYRNEFVSGEARCVVQALTD